MTTLNPLIAEIPQKITAHFPVVLDGLVPTDFIANGTSGNTLEFVYAGKLWLRDDTDVTTASDGVLCFVTLDNVRFKCNGILGQSYGVWSVLSFTNTPPAMPTAGDTYGVGTTPTGVWASHGDAIATCLVGGGSPSWGFTAKSTGLIAFDNSRSVYRSVNSSLVWADGLGLVFAVGSVAPESLIVARFTIQSQTATPPVSPSLGQYWIVDNSATGAWATKDQQIAKCTNATGPVWQFTAAVTGWKAFNVSNSHEMFFAGGIWADQQRPRIITYGARTIRSGTVTASAQASPGQATAPTSATGVLIFPDGTTSPTYTLAKTTNRLIIKVRLDLIALTSEGCLAIFIDGEATCRINNWQCFGIGMYPINAEFEIAVGDNSIHTYNVRFYDGTADVVQRAFLQFIEIET